MREKLKTSNYPSKNLKTESYIVAGRFVSKLYYDSKKGFVKELSNVEDGINEVKHFTHKGVLAKLEYFVDDKRHGIETKYFIPKANKSVKSTKTYNNGKLHGECITYNDKDEIIKQEVFADGKVVLKYVRNNSDNNDIKNIQIVDKDGIDSLPTIESEKLKENMKKNPDWFID